MNKKTSDIVAGLGSMGIATLFWVAGLELTGISRIFPLSLEIFLLLGGALLVARGLRGKYGKEEQGECKEEERQNKRVVLISAGSMACALAIPVLGFYATSALFLLAMGWLLAQERAKAGPKAVLFAATMCGFVYVVFQVLLKVPTPQGILF